MNIIFKSTYKSIDQIPFEGDLPDFVVLTGYNGAGKSHFLESISRGFLLLSAEGKNTLRPSFFRIDDFLKSSQSDSFISNEEVIERITTIVVYLVNQAKSEVLNIFKKPNFDIDLHDHDWTCDIVVEVERSLLSQLETNCLNEVPTDGAIKNIQSFFKKARVFCFYGEKEIAKIVRDCFLPSLNMLRLEMITYFRTYQERMKYNLALRQDGLSDALCDKSFLLKFGQPPWEVLADFLGKINTNFKIKDILYSEYLSTTSQLIEDHFSGQSISVNDLSSGERVLISLAFFYAYHRAKEFSLSCPQVLLLDEIDSGLHPSMIKCLLDIVKEILIDKYNLKVILTTHSPTTVALSPDDSIFLMDRNKVQKISKVDKSFAISALTQGLSLSVQYEDIRQVFVESVNDARLYTKIFEIMKKYCYRVKENPKNIYFIGVGKNDGGSGGCELVARYVQELRNGQNDSVFGIIDSDSKVKENGKDNPWVKVLGDFERYSIENYLLDPLLIIALLMHDSSISNGDLGIDEDVSFLKLHNLDVVTLQRLVDFFMEKIDLDGESSSTIKCAYCGGITLDFPEGFLKMQGHKLENLLYEKFPCFRKYNKNHEHKLKDSVINFVLKYSFELMPRALYNTLFEIQNGT